MDFDRQTLDHWADVRCTSEEIARAILEIANDDAHADAIWMAEVSDDILKQVEARAWEICDQGDPECKRLHWGHGTLDRD